MKRSIIAGLIMIAIALGAGSGIADASVKQCGPGMVLDTQGGVSACKPMPVTPGHHGHRARARAISQWPN
ncbi:MAG: hypothetical protein JST44_25775 [Cyanobacteria bacterium SZAS LIN-5]|jgi:hypothetical protein|nr:hypothetical protein [Cyanobacteria bacterium SZAS LIN-5]